jgi:hypothetical protein
MARYYLSMNPWKLTTFLFAGLFAATVAFQAVPTAAADKQPHMKMALAALKKAATQLDKASHDKGGHRKKALELTREAITEVEKGISFDNKQ